MGPDTIAKVTALHEACPACSIEVDGGINLETAKDVTESGANLLVAGSAIFNAADIPSAINALQL